MEDFENKYDNKSENIKISDEYSYENFEKENHFDMIVEEEE